MSIPLKQSTAVTLKLGPFVDATDGVTNESALTISQADIRLSKNGGNIAQSNNAAGATYDEVGFYDVPLDTTDTGTLGTLDVIVNESGALHVWARCVVLPANVFDSMFSTDKIQVDVVEWNGTAVATPTVAGVPEVDLTHVGGATTSVSTMASSVATVESRLRGLVITTGTIGSTGNSTTTLHLTGQPFGDDEINDLLLVVFDVSASEYHARWVTDWVNATAVATVATLPFTPQNATDTYWLLPIRQDVTGGSGLDAAGVRAAVGLASANLDTQLSTIDTVVDAILVDTGTTLDGRIPAALVGGRMDANLGAISTDATAADNAEAFFDGTGYAGTGNVIPTVTNVTTVNSLAANTLTAAVLATDAGTEIAAAVIAAAQADPIHANIEEVNNVQIQGAGTSGDKWRPA